MLYARSSRIAGELRTLTVKNVNLAQLIWDLTVFVQDHFRKDVVVTELFRTREMQERYYGKDTKRVSNHQRWSAVDIRYWIYNQREIQAILSFLKAYDSYNRLAIMRCANRHSRTVLLHNMGRGMHFHVQYRGPRVQQVHFVPSPLA